MLVTTKWHQPVVQTLCTVLRLLWKRSNVPWVTCASAVVVVVVVVKPMRRKQVEVVVVEVHAVDEETRTSKSMCPRRTLTLRVAMPNSKRQLALLCHRKMILPTVARVGITVKERKARQNNVVRLITNRLHSSILFHLQLMLLPLVLVADPMVVDEEDEVEVEEM